MDKMSFVDTGRFLFKATKTFSFYLNGLPYIGFNSIGPDSLETVLSLFLSENRSCHADSKFLWNDLKEQGYITQLAADSNDVFRPDSCGRGVKASDFDVVVSPRHVSAKHKSDSCFGSVAKHELIFTSLVHFFRQFQKRPKFSFAHLSQFARDVTAGRQLPDRRLSEFLWVMHSEGHLDNTLVVMMSAHGQTTGAFRMTKQGRVEERMPYLAVRYPPSLTHSRLDLLEHAFLNSQKLVTVRDLRQTLLHVSGLPPSQGHGISLLRPISAQRSCHDAGVSIHYCAFLRMQRRRHDYMQQVIADVTHELNARLHPVRHLCEKLEVNQVLRFGVYHLCDTVLVENTAPFQLTVTVKPSDAVFDATVHYVNRTSVVQQMDVSRVDDLERGACVQSSHPHLTELCVCRKNTLRQFFRWLF